VEILLFKGGRRLQQKWQLYWKLWLQEWCSEVLWNFQRSITCLLLNQHLMHLLYIWCCITFCYGFQRTLASSSQSLIFNSSIFGASTGCKHLSKCVGKMQSSHWCTIILRFCEGHLWCIINTVFTRIICTPAYFAHPNF
jgi:hypothetical protein